MFDLESISTRLGTGISEQLAATVFPPMYRVHQRLPRPVIEDIGDAVAAQFARPEVRRRINPGDKVCLAVGSRGIAGLADIVREVVQQLRALNARPFIVPAMGSHGGATPEGQTRVLADLGITADTVGAPIESTLDVVTLGTLTTGCPVYFSSDAANADAIVPINRIKPHTAFRGPVESGLMKMMTAGLGKQCGAEALHAQGMARFGRLIPAAARRVMETQPIAFGLAIVENGHEEPARIEAVLPEGLEEREKELLVEARSLIPSLPFESLDVLVVRSIGKDISGSGLDPAVCGRTSSRGGGTSPRPRVNLLAVLDLTDETAGNAVGIGMADLTTLRVVKRIDFASTYANCITASHLASATLPMTMESDRTCIALALRAIGKEATGEVPRLAIIRNTRELMDLWISASLVQEAMDQASLEVNETPVPLEFRADGTMLSPATEEA